MSTPYLVAVVFGLMGGVTWGVISDLRRPLRHHKRVVRRLAHAAATSALILILANNGPQLTLATLHLIALLPMWVVWATLFALLTTVFFWVQK